MKKIQLVKKQTNKITKINNNKFTLNITHACKINFLYCNF